jgi:hypothetical protein
MEYRSPFIYKKRSAYELAIRKYQNAEGLPIKQSAHVAAMLDSIPWRLFLTVRGNRGHGRLVQVINDFRSNCERTFHAPLTIVYSLEADPYWHAHACITSSCNLGKPWNSSVCHRVLKDLVGRDPDAYNLQPYDPSQNGLAYVLKTMDNNWDDRSEQGLINCELFIQPERQNARPRRLFRRQQGRLAKVR